MESLHCQNCKNEFILTQSDIDLLIKLKVPIPTFCSDCSHQRRFAWRNTHALYHRPDSVTGKDVISIYHPDVQMNIVDQKYWWSDEWDPMDYGREYDFSKPFFEQWKELRNVIPFQSLSNSKAVNSDYCNVAEESYDCYLISASWKNERVMYSDSLVEVKDSVDVLFVNKVEFCYEDVYCSNSSMLLYSEKCSSCIDSYFLYDCKNCTNCFMSSNLRNKSYVFENVQLTKEEYQEKLKNLDLGSYKQIQSLKKSFEELKLKSIHKFAIIVNSYNVTGDNLDNVTNCKNAFDVLDNVKDSSHIYWCVKNIFDITYCNAVGMIESSFEMNDAGVGGSFCRFSSVVYTSNEVDYSFNCYNSHDLFGCIGLRNKSYCILNKQYTKEEYFELLPRIKEHMMNMLYIDRKGRVYTYGEFFPIELSPFAYNETVANDFYPLSKEQIKEQGYSYREKENKNYTISLPFSEIPDSIKEITDNILDQVIECDTLEGSDRCTTAFKITEQELLFYRRLSIPLPRRCYQCRHKARFQKRNPLKLWSRQCMNGSCQNTFQTSYAPQRPEKVFCDDCYKKEVL